MRRNKSEQPSEHWIDRVELAIAAVLQSVILAIVVASLFQGRWLDAFNGTVILTLTFAPAMIEVRLAVTAPDYLV